MLTCQWKHNSQWGSLDLQFLSCVWPPNWTRTLTLVNIRYSRYLYNYHSLNWFKSIGLTNHLHFVIVDTMLSDKPQTRNDTLNNNSNSSQKNIIPECQIVQCTLICDLETSSVLYKAVLFNCILTRDNKWNTRQIDSSSQKHNHQH
jgi:hypothetical protein